MAGRLHSQWLFNCIVAELCSCGAFILRVFLPWKCVHKRKRPWAWNIAYKFVCVFGLMSCCWQRLATPFQILLVLFVKHCHIFSPSSCKRYTNTHALKFVWMILFFFFCFVCLLICLLVMLFAVWYFCLFEFLVVYVFCMQTQNSVCVIVFIDIIRVWLWQWFFSWITMKRQTNAEDFFFAKPATKKKENYNNFTKQNVQMMRKQNWYKIQIRNE